MNIGLAELFIIGYVVALLVTVNRARKSNVAALACPRCNFGVSRSANFCSNCGTVLRSAYPSAACPACGRIGSADSNFCRECGASMVQRAI